MHADGDNIIILYYCHQRSSFISHAIHHIELLSLFTTAILCFICIFLIFAMSVSHHNSLSLRDRFTCLFGAVVAIMIIAVLALLSFSSFSITFFLIVVAIIVFVIIAPFCFFFHSSSFLFQPIFLNWSKPHFRVLSAHRPSQELNFGIVILPFWPCNFHGILNAPVVVVDIK